MGVRYSYPAPDRGLPGTYLRPPESGGEDGVRNPLLIAETLMFIGVWRFIGQTIGQLNDQIRLIPQNVQKPVSRGLIPGKARTVSTPLHLALLVTRKSLVVGHPE